MANERGLLWVLSFPAEHQIFLPYKHSGMKILIILLLVVGTARAQEAQFDPQTFSKWLKDNKVSLIATAVKAAFEGASDGFEYHSDHLGESFWNGKWAWLQKHKNRDPRQGPAFFGSTTFLAGITSGDHLMQTFAGIAGNIAVVFAPGRGDKRFWPTVRDIVVYQFVYNLSRAAVLELCFQPRMP